MRIPIENKMKLDECAGYHPSSVIPISVIPYRSFFFITRNTTAIITAEYASGTRQVSRET